VALKQQAESKLPEEWAKQLNEISTQWEDACQKVQAYVAERKESAQVHLSEKDNLREKFGVVQDELLVILKAFFSVAREEQQKLLHHARTLPGDVASSALTKVSGMVRSTEQTLAAIVSSKVESGRTTLSHQYDKLSTWARETSAVAAASPAVSKLSAVADAARQRHQHPELLRDDARQVIEWANPFLLALFSIPVVVTLYTFFYNLLLRAVTTAVKFHVPLSGRIHQHLPKTAPFPAKSTESASAPLQGGQVVQNATGTRRRGKN